MNRLRITGRAVADLDGIARYIRHDAIDAADRILLRFHALFYEILANPKIGRAREDFGGEVRSLPDGRYLVFCRTRPDGIEILRIIHSARDLHRIGRLR